ncbi:hypothetical protein IAQ61_010462 [Plenodomus lingam]|uniref:uncharacterized protein n=1 Tax=Leptosphaeria maculans TaxID=5022 RepID=UPI00333358F1|nr:hypothetical protein IAQ61_010462 [Plenodomus lingam]
MRVPPSRVSTVVGRWRISRASSVWVLRYDRYSTTGGGCNADYEAGSGDGAGAGAGAGVVDCLGHDDLMAIVRQQKLNERRAACGESGRAMRSWSLNHMYMASAATVVGMVATLHPEKPPSITCLLLACSSTYNDPQDGLEWIE